MSNARVSERERDAQRVEKHGTSRNASGASEHSARSLIAQSLTLFSRAQMLRERAEEQSYVKSARTSMLLQRVRIPVCFVRRSGVIDDVCDQSALYDDAGVVLRFDGRNQRTARPLLAQTNLLIDRAPADLHAASYEVRYLTIFELALLATRSVARPYLKDASVAAMRTVRQTRDSETPHVSAPVFDNAVDVAYEPKADVNDAMRREFAHALEHLRISKLQQPLEHRLPLVTRTQDIAERHDFQQPVCRVFALDIERAHAAGGGTKANDDNGDDGDEDDHIGNKERAQQRYSEEVQFRLRYLHMQSFASGHVGKSRSVQIPARLFAKQYDDPHARKLNSTDVGLVERVLRERLARALERFGRPVRDDDALLDLFGDAAHIKRFEALLQWRTREFAHASNYRATAHALLRALHRFMDDVERCTFDDDEFERTFGVETRAWDCWRGAAHKRQHARLFSFVKGTDTAHNEWDHDDGRPATQRGITQMMAPEDIGARFYQRHWRAELESEAQQAFVLNSETPDAQRHFWRTWRRTDARRATHAGSTPTATFAAQSETLASMLAFECDPIDCADPSARNDYGSIFQQQQRQLAPYNPFVRFANNVFNYVSSRTSTCRWEQQESDSDATIYVESTLSRHITNHCLEHVDAAVRDAGNGTAGAVCSAALPALEPGPLRDMYAKALETVRSPYAAKGGNWVDVQHALRLDASAAINDFVIAWGKVEHVMQRAAMCDRSASALNTPFSTLYDFGVHCLCCREGEEVLAAAAAARRAQTKTAALPNVEKNNISESARVRDKPEDAPEQTPEPIPLPPRASDVERHKAAPSASPPQQPSLAATDKPPPSSAESVFLAGKRGYAYVIKKPSESKIFSGVGIGSRRKRNCAASVDALETLGATALGADAKKQCTEDATNGRKSGRVKRQTERLCM